MKSLRFFKKVIAFIFIVFSLSFLFQESSFAQAQTHDSPAQPLAYQLDSSTKESTLPSSQIDDTDWVITSVPIHPLFPGVEWEVKSEQNGSKLIIKHGDEEVLTLVKKGLLE